MGEAREPDRVALVVAAFSRHPTALDWGRERLEASFGPVALVSAILEFNQTSYYAQSMGSDLQKQFFAFRQLLDPGSLAGVKRLTNNLEDELTRSGNYPELRPLNLDP